MTHDFGDGTSDWSVTERIVWAVANERNVDVTELEPLYEVVDTDALEAIVTAGIDGHVAFSYHGLQVFVHGDGDVELGGTDAPSVTSPV